GVIDDQGGFFPMSGTYPVFLKKGEGKEEDDTPGMVITLTIMALLGAAMVASRTRRGGDRR
ncbi:MAG: hypothetical protein GWN18_16950, partial [Thermoplasmata archaeon]|nr:hypothetical protein [Thermoplasmata archaeon]NIS21647.1 hypothetical protein [Thermoplasmata archaeon]NIT79231.1 hypothetical protein [Thermoplasmata archaeon]NIU50677.1 hypothetical protein [Thermoplasmata archaeon]NIV80399.1 hypothetical protein [Thermoplasmata archaeon]